MYLKAFDIYQYTRPLTEPIRWGNKHYSERTGFLIRLENEYGVESWGEVAPLPYFSPESLDEARMGLYHVRSQFLGKNIPQIWHPRSTISVPDVSPLKSVSFGFALAVWNLFAKDSNLILPELITDKFCKTIPLNGLLLGTPKEILSKLNTYTKQAYKTLKIKVGSNPLHEDIELIQEIAKNLPESCQLRLDANQAWHLSEASMFAEAVAPLGVVEYLEEPLKNPLLLDQLHQNTIIPLALDESLRVGNLPQSILDVASIFVVKPSLVGGLSTSLANAKQYHTLGKKVVLSATFETGIGIQGLLSLASVILSEKETPIGLDTYRFLAEDIIHPRLPLENAAIDIATILQKRHTVQTDQLTLIP